MAFFSLGMVVVSTLTFILSTMEDQEFEGKETPFSKVLDVIDAGVIIYFTLVSFTAEKNEKIAIPTPLLIHWC